MSDAGPASGGEKNVGSDAPTVHRRALPESAPTVARPGVTAPGAIPPPAPPEGQPFGRYVLLQELGHGGMGIVWKAWDTELSRIVALKGILGEQIGGEEKVQRFLREARLAAKLRHPNIVGVHDVGVHEKQHYFTADYIEGRTLAAVLAEGPVPVRQGVAWIRSIAEAVAYAHEQGVVHRDLKPANVLIDAAGQPFVMDFGLAREVNAEKSLTMTGDLMGTPTYMSPEQATGRINEVGPPSDQFSLGATLYEVLTRRLPFEAPDLRGLLNAVAEADPPPPSRVNPRVHPDLDVICLKALEKARALRYADMRAFATDLTRWLDGEPIAAKAASGATRLWRAAMKHRAVVLPSLAAALLAVGFGVYALVIHFRGLEERAQKARELAAAQAQRLQEVNAAYEKEYLVSEVLARFKSLAPTLQELEAIRDGAELGEGESTCGPSRAEASFPREYLERRKEELWRHVQAFLAGTPADPASQATAWPLAGWARHLYGDPATAEAWMRKGTAIDPEVPYGKLLDAMRLFAAYVDAQQLPVVSVGPAGPELWDLPAESAAMREERERIRVLLSEAEEARVWGRQGAEQYREALAAMRAMQEGRYADAEPHLTRALESLELEPMRGSLLPARAMVRYLRKEFDAAADDLTESLVIRSGRAEVWNLRALAREAQGKDLAWKGADPRGCYAGGMSDAGEALKRNPGWKAAFNTRGNLHLEMGEADGDRGEDPRGELEKAVADYTAALQIDPEFQLAYTNRGAAEASLAEADANRGIDPRERYARAIADEGQALRLDAGSADAYNNRGNMYQQLGSALATRGLDPTESYEKGIADYDALLRLQPGRAGAFSNRSRVYLSLGDAKAERREDPREAYRKAIADLDEALRILPDFARAWWNRGTTYQVLARAEAARGIDPMGSFEKAIADLGEALRRNPSCAGAYNDRGNTLLLKAEAQVAKGLDARESFERAFADYAEALKCKADDSDTFGNRSHGWVSLAQTQATRGEDPRPSLKRAISDASEALRLNPRHANACRYRGKAYRALGEAAAARGGDPCPALQRAIEEFGTALQINPAFFDVYDERGHAYLLLGEESRKRGADPRDLFLKGIADFAETLRHDPDRAEAYVNRAVGHQWLAGLDAANGKDPMAEHQAAEADYAEALKRDPNDAETFGNRAQMYVSVGDGEAAQDKDPHESYEKAIADASEALRLKPDLVTAYNKRGSAYIGIGAWQAAKGLDPREWFEKAIADHGEVLKRNPNDADAWYDRGNGYARLADAEAARGIDPRATYLQAISDYGEALKRNPNIVGAYNNRGNEHKSLAELDARHGQDSRGSFEEAVTDYHDALKRDPRMWQARLGLGQVYEDTAQPAKAVEEYEAALRIVGDGYPPLKGFLARAKAAASK